MRPTSAGACFAVVLSLSSCFGAPNYLCDADTQCRWGDHRGVCEDTHYCSYADEECPSGARYSDQAGELAGRCVDEPTGTSSTSSAATTDATGDDPITDLPPQPICGDGMREGDEGCDDANDVDGDGCNVDCVPSGTPRWDPAERTYSGAEDTDARFWDVEVRPDGTIIAVGLEVVFDQDALAVLFDGDGEILWTRQYDPGAGTSVDIARGVLSTPDGAIYLIGHSPNPTSTEGWIAEIEPSNGALAAFEWTGRTYAYGVAHMDPSTIVVAGHGSMLVGARAYTDALAPAWVAESMVASATILAVAVDDDRGIAYAAGQFDAMARVVQLVPDAAEPLVTVFEGPAESTVQTLEIHDGELVFGGSTGAERDGWLERMDPSGAPLWSWTSGEPTHAEIEDVAIAANGDVIAGGFVVGLEQDARVWKLSPAGELLWTWTWDEPLANDDIVRAVAVFPEGDIVVVGSRTPRGVTEGWVVRLTP